MIETEIPLKGNPHFPVNSLMENVRQTFIRLNHELDFRMAFEKGLSNKIKMVMTDKPITDVSELDDLDQIILYDNFCQFYWCLCYSSILLYDKGIIEKLKKLKFQGNIDLANDELKTAFAVFMAGVGLFQSKNAPLTSRSAFFELPNPYNKTTNPYVGSSNGVYNYGMAFILFHEYSHFILGHSIISSKKEEEDADANSFWTLYINVPEEEKITATLGIITAICALIFLDGTMKGDDYHPDSDLRLASVLENLDPEYDHYWGLACISIKMWAFHYELDKDFPDVKELDSWKDYFKILLNHLYYFKLKQPENFNS